MRVTVLLPPESAARLARLAERYGSKTAAVIAALEKAEEGQ